MLSKYLHAAMRLAKYKILEDGTYYGDIPGFRGVLANAATLEDCREQLQEVLEDWILVGVKLGHALPIVDKIKLVVEAV
jgi:predicted RNase H-like HicB family nuclease